MSTDTSILSSKRKYVNNSKDSSKVSHSTNLNNVMTHPFRNLLQKKHVKTPDVHENAVILPLMQRDAVTRARRLRMQHQSLLENSPEFTGDLTECQLRLRKLQQHRERLKQFHDLTTFSEADEKFEQKKMEEPRKKDVTSSMRDEIMKKLINKFNVDKVLEEIKECQLDNTLHKLHFISSKMVQDTSINFNSFQRILEEIGLLISRAEANWIFRSLDKDSSGKINYEEIKKLCKMLSRIEFPIYSQLFIKIFNIIDIDHSGWIDTEELIDFLRDIGFEINERTSDMLNERHGNKLNFQAFLGVFDFNKDTLIKYKYDESSSTQVKSVSLGNVKHIVVAKKFDKKGFSQEINLDEIHEQQRFKERRKVVRSWIKCKILEKI